MDIKYKKYLKNIILIFFVLLLTFHHSFGMKELYAIPSIIRNVQQQYILIAILTMFSFFLCQSIATKRLLHAFGYKATVVQCFRYSLIDYYFSSITPGSSGGQPSEIYYMKKDGIAVSESSLIMLLYNSIYHIAVIAVIFIFTLGNIHYILGESGILLTLFKVGMLIQFLLAAIFFLLIFASTFLYNIIDRMIVILNFYQYKKVDQLEETIKKSLDSYQTSADWIAKNPKIFVEIIPIILLQITLFYSISYWIGKAFGVENISLIKMIAYQGVFIMTFESLPLPGGIGVAETGFLRIFSRIYTKETLAGALLLTRGITYYCYLLLGAFMSFLSKGQKVHRIKNIA